MFGALIHPSQTLPVHFSVEGAHATHRHIRERFS
jgi:hypothetical protein